VLQVRGGGGTGELVHGYAQVLQLRFLRARGRGGGVRQGLQPRVHRLLLGGRGMAAAGLGTREQRVAVPLQPGLEQRMCGNTSCNGFG